MMRREKVIRNAVLVTAVMILSMGAGILSEKPESCQARSKVSLSRTKRSYDMTGLWDKLKLKGVSKKAKIRWSSSDTKVVKIRSRSGSGIWYEVLKDGKANVVASYNKKKFTCRITVKSIEPESDDEDVSREQDDVGATNESESDDDQDVRSTQSSEPTETQAPAKTTFRKEVEDRLASLLTDVMSEYDKMEAIVKHVSNDYDYELGQYDFQIMFRSGRGDCMASRYLVEYMARAAGLRAYALDSVNAHGEALVRVGDTVFMTVTGTNMPRPRTYMIYEMSMENLERLKNGNYPNVLKKLGFE